MRYLFGPVDSRRLGVSLGVDIIPFKTCSLNCVYCECGATTRLTAEPAEYAPTPEVIAELDGYLSSRPKLDAITFSGCGEPTLHSGIGEIISFLKAAYPEYRVAVLTNGTLLNRAAVRESLLNADMVVPSLDAASEHAFQTINRPAPGLTAAGLIEGLAAFRSEYRGKLLLEIFIVPGINDGEDEIGRIKEALPRIRPDRIQLNTLDRPGTDRGLRPASRRELEAIALLLDGFEVEIVGAPRGREGPGLARAGAGTREDLLATIGRRPSTVEELTNALGLGRGEVEEMLRGLLDEGLVRRDALARGEFYSLRNEGPEGGHDDEER